MDTGVLPLALNTESGWFSSRADLRESNIMVRKKESKQLTNKRMENSGELVKEIFIW